MAARGGTGKEGDAAPRFYRRAAALRFAAALLWLALFLLAYTAGRREWNGLLHVLMATQFSPVLIGGGARVGIAAMCALFLMPLLWGRLYCSVLCPMGTLQEIVWRVGGLLRKKAGRAFVRPWRARYAVPVLAGIGIFLGVTPLMISLDPISTFGRGVTGIANLLRGNAQPLAPISLFSLVFFAIILLLALLRGRRFCDWCPVGVALGFPALVAYGVRTDGEKCVGCGLCERACPMNCVEVQERGALPHTPQGDEVPLTPLRRALISRERCVVCLRCAAVCPTGAVRAGFDWRSLPRGRRKFLADGGRIALGMLAYCTYLVFGTLDSPRKAAPPRGAGDGGAAPPILPPGAGDMGRYASLCVSCQACAAACPVKILKPKGSPHPMIDYTEDYCQFTCHDCGKVCPTGAIRPLGEEEKQRTRVALSRLRIERCVVVERRQACGACAEVCPTHALRMQPYEEARGLPEPVFDEAYCIGCGACRVACPVTSEPGEPGEPKALEIAGVPRQTTTPGIRPSDDEGTAQPLPGMSEDFPF